jgi:hypothetical protein
MRYIITKQIQFCGIALRSHATEGSVQTRSAATTLDGNAFRRLKEQAIDIYAEYLGWSTDGLDSLIAIFHPNNATEIFVNEIQYTDYESHKLVDGKRSSRLKLLGLQIPEECGIILYLPWGCHHLAMYDVTPVLQKSEERRTKTLRDKRRQEDYELVLGSLVDQIDCQVARPLNDSEWNVLFEAGWFPFAFLQGSIWCEICEKINRQEDLSSTLAKITESIKFTWADRIYLWRLHPVLKYELDFLVSAHDCFVAGNWIAVNSILGPRIEGIITGTIGKFLKHQKMITTLGHTIQENDPGNVIINSERLMQYFKKVVFLDGNMMNPTGQNVGINRHLLGHGRVLADSLDQKAAVLRFLTIDHLSRYHPSGNK